MLYRFGLDEVPICLSRPWKYSGLESNYILAWCGADELIDLIIELEMKILYLY